ncbi:MAG: hypothetical protein ABIS15_07325, partial [Gemmatimonadaceae bacterium]
FRDAVTSAVPEWLPHRASLVTISGILEIIGAIGLVFRPSREIAGWCLMGLLVAVFPGNIKMLNSAHLAGGPVWLEALLWMRLPLQPLLIWMVYRYSASPLVTAWPVEARR